MNRHYDIPQSEFDTGAIRVEHGGLWFDYKNTAKRRKCLNSMTVPLFGSGLRVAGPGLRQNETTGELFVLLPKSSVG